MGIMAANNHVGGTKGQTSIVDSSAIKHPVPVQLMQVQHVAMNPYGMVGMPHMVSGMVPGANTIQKSATPSKKPRKPRNANSTRKCWMCTVYGKVCEHLSSFVNFHNFVNDGICSTCNVNVWSF